MFSNVVTGAARLGDPRWDTERPDLPDTGTAELTLTASGAGEENDRHTTSFGIRRFGNLPDLHLLRLRLTDAHGTPLSENTYWRCRAPEAMRALNRMQRTPDLRRHHRHRPQRGDRTVTNRGPAVAATVRVSLLDARTGHRVLPTLYGDNYLWLLPGESRTVTASWPADVAVSRPQVRVEAYNAPPSTGNA